MLRRWEFLSGLSANLISFALLAASGLLLNSLIATYYGAAALGVFNQVFVIYILCSQLGTVGVQFSVLRYIAEFSKDALLSARILSSALVVVAFSSTITVALCIAALGVERHIYSEQVVASTPFMLPGLWAFAINKVFLNALNGARRNILYATFTGSRHVLLGSSVVIALIMRIPSYELSVILSSSELVLMVALGVGCQQIFPGYLVATSAEWMRRHMRFGVHSILGGLAVEMNTRVDVLVLGLFTSDAAVGIYSFAAFFVEGILQLPQLARRILDPVLTIIIVEGERAKLHGLMRSGRNLGAISMVLVSIMGVLLYPFVARIIGGSNIAAESRNVFVILMIGTCIFGAYAVFSGLFSQAGLPLVQSHLNVLILATNMILNLALAPLYGVYGAAIATSLSFIIATLLFRRLVRLHFGIRM